MMALTFGQVLSYRRWLLQFPNSHASAFSTMLPGPIGQKLFLDDIPSLPESAIDNRNQKKPEAGTGSVSVPVSNLQKGVENGEFS